MKLSNRYSVAALLLLSSVSLTVLVPGGPIETRDFSHIDPFVLGGFNTFLTTLSLVSWLLVYFVWNSRHWAFIASSTFGLFYFLVYVLDLARLFPVSPDAMPPALFGIEVLGTILSIPLAILAMKAALNQDEQPEESLQHGTLSDVLVVENSDIDQRRTVWSISIVFFGLLLGLGIIIFATRSAMGL